MFFKTLDAIRKKPAHIRRTVSLFVSLGITLVIGLVWYSYYTVYLQEASQDGLFGKGYGSLSGSDTNTQMSDGLSNFLNKDSIETNNNTGLNTNTDQDSTVSNFATDNTVNTTDQDSDITPSNYPGDVNSDSSKDLSSTSSKDLIQ